jgi:RIO kinase 1
VDEAGPIIIDLPQAVDAAGNNNAHAMLTRDVENMTNYYGQFAPELLETQYAKEIWALYEEGNMDVDFELTGKFVESNEAANVDSVIAEIKAAIAEEDERQERIRDANDDEED